MLFETRVLLFLGLDDKDIMTNLAGEFYMSVTHKFDVLLFETRVLSIFTNTTMTCFEILLTLSGQIG